MIKFFGNSVSFLSSVMSIAPGITGIGEYIFSGFEFWING